MAAAGEHGELGPEPGSRQPPAVTWTEPGNVCVCGEGLGGGGSFSCVPSAWICVALSLTSLMVCLLLMPVSV